MDVSRITDDGLPPPPQSASEFAADLQFDLETRQSQVCVRLTVQAAGGSTSIIVCESRPLLLPCNPLQVHPLASQQSTTWRTLATQASPSGRPPLPTQPTATAAPTSHP